jgi:hypothetical protein
VTIFSIPMKFLGSPGHGFLYKKDDQVFLVTAAHNTGRFDSSHLKFHGEDVKERERKFDSIINKFKAYISSERVEEINLKDTGYIFEENYDILMVPFDEEIPECTKAFSKGRNPENIEAKLSKCSFPTGYPENPLQSFDIQDVECEIIPDNEECINTSSMSFASAESQLSPGVSGSPVYKDSKLYGIFTHGRPLESKFEAYFWKYRILEELASKEIIWPTLD